MTDVRFVLGTFLVIPPHGAYKLRPAVRVDNRFLLLVASVAAREGRP
ncbi:MAG: hypothetical protein ACE15D_07355 [Candidatus Eisenbacteria bacterium]